MLRFAAVCVSLLGIFASVRAAGPAAGETAAAVDALIARHLDAASVTPAPQASDEDFLRRVHLDLAGSIPTPAQVRAFISDSSPSKRQAVIDELLAAPEFAETWASYWKDVIYLRSTEQRARQAQPVFQQWLEDQFAANRPWNEMAREMLTATGNTLEEGQTGLIFAQGGEAEELAAEVSRVFLGIQLSCANCHDHPTDSWKRQQFHELAAFLPRITLRPQDVEGVRTFFVTSFEELPGRGGRRGALAGPNGQPDGDRIFRQFDQNRDNKLAKSEVQGPLAQQFDRMLENGDSNKDGMLSKEEFAAARMPNNQQPGRGSAEYYMPDLNNPASQGKQIKPSFFLTSVRGPNVRTGASDLERRNALADYITSTSNPWFARAFVNRVWAEMLGTGFYMPIDDMGPERTATYDDVLNALSQAFVASNHDVKWLYGTIASTQAYQRKMSSADAYPAPFAAVSPTRLRGDQVYNSISQVLGEPLLERGGGRRGGRRGALLQPQNPARGNTNLAQNRGAAGNPAAVGNPAAGENLPQVNPARGGANNPAGQRRGNGNNAQARRGAADIPNLAGEGNPGQGEMMAGGRMDAMDNPNAMANPEQMPAPAPNVPAGRGGPQISLADRQRNTFTELFGFDPSTPQEDILGTIPQALFMMNAPQVDRRIQSFGIGTLGAISRQNPRSEDAIREVYLLALSRQPTPQEMEVNLGYIREVGSRSEALEDILWSLMNSTEFVSKR